MTDLPFSRVFKMSLSGTRSGAQLKLKRNEDSIGFQPFHKTCPPEVPADLKDILHEPTSNSQHLSNQYGWKPMNCRIKSCTNHATEKMLSEKTRQERVGGNRPLQLLM